MVITRYEWFKKKKTSDFKIFGYPWQSAACILSIFILALCVILPENLLVKLMAILMFYFMVIDILFAYQKSLDERQILNHAIVCRNAFLGIVITLILIQAINYNLNPNYQFMGNMTYFTTLSTPLPSAITYNLNPQNIIILTILPLLVGFLTMIFTSYQQSKGKFIIMDKITGNIQNILLIQSKWFKRKNKSNYWILDIQWQGSIYILIMILLILLLGGGGLIITILLVIFLLFMTINYLIAYQKSLDERQQLHHAIAERNAFWGLLIALIITQSILFNYNQNLKFIYLLIPLPAVFGFLVGFISYYKLQNEVLFL